MRSRTNGYGIVDNPLIYSPFNYGNNETGAMPPPPYNFNFLLLNGIDFGLLSGFDLLLLNGV